MSEALIGEIQPRNPVLSKDSITQFPDHIIERAWITSTERIKREMLVNPQARQSIMQFCTAPVDETLPRNFIDLLPAEAASKGGVATLKKYLSIPAVPNEAMGVDLRNTDRYYTEEEMITEMREIGYNEADINERIEGRRQRISEKGAKGITLEEYEMVVRRYRFARDVKILALGAELLDQGIPAPTRNGTVEEFDLPSGIKIGLDGAKPEEKADLLRPDLWVKRKQLKDRVYEIEVNGRKYLLKERKTPRHTDTKKGGHYWGLTSENEFKTAKFFNEQVKPERDRTFVTFEKPIAFATFPDGFSFAVFEFEEGLVGIEDIHRSLMQQILKRRIEFEDEYQDVAKKAKKLVDDPRIKRFAFSKQDNGIPARQLSLSYEAFANVKAHILLQQSGKLRQSALADNLYSNSDMDGYAFRVHTEKGRLQLEEACFDFEYFERITEDERKRHEKFTKEHEQIERQLRFGANYHTRMEQAAVLAINNW